MGIQEGIQDIVNEAVEAETAMLRNRIRNLEDTLIDLVVTVETAINGDFEIDVRVLQKLVDRAKSVVEGEFED